MTKQLKLSALIAALLVSANAFADKPGYLADQQTDGVTRNSYNECWRTTYFNKDADGLVECGDKAPPPAVVDTPPPPQPVTITAKEKITLSAEVLFAFDKATLRPEAKTTLDPLLNRLKNDSHLKNINIEGYTDALGSEQYNKALSQRRAQAVAHYFVQGGVSSDKLSTVGRGEADAKMTYECKNKFKKKALYNKLKDCLGPDRRVEMTITTYQHVKKQITPPQ